MEEIDLDLTDKLILKMLREGGSSPFYLAQEIGYRRQNVTNRPGRLTEHGYVEKFAPRLYELMEDPRDEDVIHGSKTAGGDDA